MGYEQTNNEMVFTIHSEVGAVDNFLYDNNNTEHTSFFKLLPTITIKTEFEHHLVQLLAESEHVSFQAFSQDNYSNFNIAPSYQFKPAINQTFFVNTRFSEQYEARGTGLSLGNARALWVGDTKQTAELQGGFLYGREDSVAKLRFVIGQNTNRYKTRRDVTRILDRNSVYINPSFDYLIGGGSYFTSEIKAERVSYKHNEALSKNKYVGLLGFKWQPSTITDLALLLGYQEIQFEQSALANDSAIKWRVNLGWKPLEDLSFTLMSERDFAEANKLQDSYRLVDNLVVGVHKKWHDYLAINARVGFNSQDVVSPMQLTTEDYLTTNIAIHYQRNSWLSFYFTYDFKGLDASISSLDYQRNSLSIGFNATL